MNKLYKASELKEKYGIDDIKIKKLIEIRAITRISHGYYDVNDWKINAYLKTPRELVNHYFKLFKVAKKNQKFEDCNRYISIICETCLDYNLDYKDYFMFHNISKKTELLSGYNKNFLCKRNKLDQCAKKAWKKQDIGTAQKKFSELLDLEKGEVYDAHIGIAKTLIRQQKYDEALIILLEGFETEPYLKYLPFIAKVYSSKDEYEKLIEIVNLYNKYTNNKSEAAYIELLAYYVSKSDFVNASSLAKKCEEINEATYMESLSGYSSFYNCVEEVIEVNDMLKKASRNLLNAQTLFEEINNSLKFTVENVLELSKKYYGENYNELMIELSLLLYKKQYKELAKNIIKALELTQVERKKYNKGLAHIQQNKALYKGKARYLN
jgi:hypothetical protein